MQNNLQNDFTKILSLHFSQNNYTKMILLFPCFFMLQEQPDGARQQNGSVGTAATAHQHGKGEIMNRLAAEQEDRHDGKQGSDRRVNGTGQPFRYGDALSGFHGCGQKLRWCR